MKINYLDTPEEFFFSEVRDGAVFFFANGEYKTMEGSYDAATGVYMRASGRFAVNLDDGTSLYNVSKDTKVYFPKEVKLNIKK